VKGKIRSHLNRGAWWLGGLLLGGTVFQAGGCDEEVKGTIFSGVQTATTNLVSAFINALFLSIAPEEEPAITTVKAVIDHAASLIC